MPHQLGSGLELGLEPRNVNVEESKVRPCQNQEESIHSTKLYVPVQDKTNARQKLSLFQKYPDAACIIIINDRLLELKVTREIIQSHSFT